MFGVFSFPLLLCLVAYTSASDYLWEQSSDRLWEKFDHDLDMEWISFKKAYNKTYLEKEEPARRLIWEDNVRYIQRHNLAYDRGEYEFFLGVNDFADMSEKEFREIMLSGLIVPDEEFENTTYPEEVFDPEAEASVSMDWRSKGIVTPVKNQGSCGSCWAFSAVAALEGQHAKKTGKLVGLSEQNLVDCTRHYGNGGCRGGWMNPSFQYIKDNGGIDSESCYRYEKRDGRCRYRSNCNSAQDTGFKKVRKSESALKSDLYRVGPISVALDAGHRSFWYYKEGIYSERRCNRRRPSHAVTAVGYGSRNGDYWLVKNSWGTRWGERGYVKMTRNRGNNCGLHNFASYPTV